MRIDHHISLLAKSRTLALKECLFKTIKPGDRVLDAGTGTGILAVWAALAGAGSVVAIDREHSGLALALAESNGVAHKIRFVSADLNTWTTDEKFDGICAMIYENDPRRDEVASHIAANLVSRFLKPNGWMIPDTVRYLARLVDWPDQDWSTHFGAHKRTIDALSSQLQTDLSPLQLRLAQNPLLDLFPQRLSHGGLQGTFVDTTMAQEAFRIEYIQGTSTYPETFRLTSTRSGAPNALIWTQQILASGQLLFLNEAVSWLREPVKLNVGQEVTVNLVPEWRPLNLLSVEF